ncbi:MAG: zinc/manganese transport system substrate-binding protein [Pseudonocardiales bacterium]|jgi:zinc/manganese transport system substrate-binding protein|nr:zinc/manganese transport system substrate-binding protein [Pseudonocardiales bacterium]
MTSRRTRLPLLVLAVTAALLAACSSGAGSTGGKLGVVAGENFWGDIAAQIGGSQVKVTSIITDPNTDPHEFESNVQDAAAIQDAKVVIINGAGYDDFMAKLIAAGGSTNHSDITVADLVGATSDSNPHLWYNPDYVTKAAQAIESEFAKQRPNDAKTFRANLATFLKGEQQVRDVIAQIKAKYAGTKVSYTEPVPGYLVDAAGLVLGTPASFTRALEDGRDPSPADSAAFENALKSHTVQVLLYNNQVTDSETTRLKALATSGGVPVVGVSETLPPNEDFQTWQASQARALLAALGG